MAHLCVHIKFAADTTPQAQKDILTAILSGEGYDSFEERDDGLKAYIVQEHYDENTLKSCLQTVFGTLLPACEVRELQERNWNEEWEKNFKPVDIGGRCHIRAPFHPPSGAEYEIVLSPRMSFGTGHHATTELMMRLMLDMHLKGKNILDLGSGTGILAILADKAGAAKVMAIDYDDWAYRNALENVQENHCRNTRVLKGQLRDLAGQRFDLVLANINRNILLREMAMLSEALEPGSPLLLSGFYLSDKETISRAAEKQSFTEVKYLEKNNWVAVQYEKNGGSCERDIFNSTHY